MLPAARSLLGAVVRCTRKSIFDLINNSIKGAGNQTDILFNLIVLKHHINQRSRSSKNGSDWSVTFSISDVTVNRLVADIS